MTLNAEINKKNVILVFLEYEETDARKMPLMYQSNFLHNFQCLDGDQYERY